MQAALRTNLLLAGVLALLAWFAWPQREDAPAPPPERLTALDPATIGTIRIERGQPAEPLQLQRAQQRWWLLRAGQRLPADPLRVAQVLRLAEQPSEVSYPLSAAPLAELGLAPPRVRVTFDRQSLLLGVQEPLHYRRYVVAGERLHLVADTAHVHLVADWSAFVDPAPLAAAASLQAITTPAWRLLRGEDGGWQREPPGAPDAQLLGRRWLELQAEQVEPLAAAGEVAGEPVRLQFADGGERTLRLVREAGAARLEWPQAGVAYRLAAGAPQALGWGD